MEKSPSTSLKAGEKLAKATGAKKAATEAPDPNQEQREATHVLYPINLVQALLIHFTQTPHNMGEVEGIVNGLRQGEKVAR